MTASHWGTGAEYLYNTVSHLAQHGIHDRNLWHLQELVAEEIEWELKWLNEKRVDIKEAPMVEGVCHCGAVRWSFDGVGQDGKCVKDMWF